MVTVMNQEEPVVRQAQTRELISAAWIGAVIGLTAWILTYLLSRYVIGSIACKIGSSIIGCGDSVLVAAGLALIIACLAGLILAVRERIFRPLLVILALLVTLWGMNGTWLVGFSFFTLLASIVTATLTSSVYMWFSRMRNFWVALATIVILIVIFRLIISL